ncbi:hypothetical protein CEE69_10680 [Rhodopirellula bahusiensis]|uniref:Tetratricopeptide repeat protein n=2 Tax=Rhodopirellula bahusiensis TaxID=2014065 RepID=A0A2G1W8U9_9BACT|nr:hypothetical protein CEE69_10680 [Rhodopirellula bahusiensis]
MGVCACWILLLGCKTTAPVHVWRPPELAVEPAGVAFMGISGPDEWADPIEKSLLQNQPTRWRLIAAERLESESSIRLVSGFEEEPNDVAVSAAARREGLRYLLHGEILQATGHEDRDDKISLSWRLTGLQPDASSAGMPVSIDEALIEQRYPQLMNVPDVAERTRQAAVLETKRLLAASVDRQQVTLASPRMLPGSRAVRRGNKLARSGNWPMAEQVWNGVLESQPRNPAALINASIAAAARQDFSAARERIAEAVRRSAFSPVNQSLAEETLVWIELRQRDYHEAFDLPPPPEGWLISRGSL